MSDIHFKARITENKLVFLSKEKYLCLKQIVLQLITVLVYVFRNENNIEIGSVINILSHACIWHSVIMGIPWKVYR